MRPTAALLRAAASRPPVLRLFTGNQCSLCDDVKRVVAQASQPHSLETVDIGEKAHREFFRRYKWDIPVLHIDGEYFAKHRVELGELEEALRQASAGAEVSFVARGRAGARRRASGRSC